MARHAVCVAASLDRMLPTLVHIQTHLDDDLSLGAMAGVAGLSPSHFSRTFSAAVGESPRAYVERLRLERAAHLLVVREASILAVALDSGFRSHETFTRAFNRRFGTAPGEWRRSAVRPSRPGDGPDRRRPTLAARLLDGSLSRTTVRSRRSLPVLFARHVGSYDAVPPDLWGSVRAAAARRRVATSDILLGVAHDAPGLTPPERCRFDACIAVNQRVARDWRATGGVGAQLLPGGHFAVTTYVGPYTGLGDAYRAIVERIAARGPDVVLVGLPAVETYHTTVINPDASLNETEIALPVLVGGMDEPLEQEES